ncbi:MAG: S41 family peptidase [Gemmatimonadota bacterium]
MTRHVLALLLLLSLPLSVQAQRASAGASGTSETRAGSEEEVFRGALEAIRDFGFEARTDSLLWEMAIEGLLRELEDPYATVLNPREVAQFQEETTGNYAGIGIQISDLNEAVTVTAVFRDTPAEGAGLQVGDRIVAVDDEAADGWNINDVSQRIRGEVDTEVLVVVRREGVSDPVPHRIRRDQVHISSVMAGRIFQDIGYIHLDRFARGSAVEVDSALQLFQDSRGLILDMRRNPGGYLDESLIMADLFLERGDTLVKTRNRIQGRRAGLSEDAQAARFPPRTAPIPMVILVDRFTASAAEIVAGALQDHDRAIVLGERTFGKGVVQTIVPLPAGRQLRLTTGEWYTPLGRSLNRVRDLEGRPMEENRDSLPRFQTAQGRTLLGGGGVLPDREVPDDTLSTREQEFMTRTAQDGIPVNLRIQEEALDLAREALRGVGPGYGPEAVDVLMARLREEGVAEEYLSDPEIQAYLGWRIRYTTALRMREDGRSVEIRAERDKVLSEAVEILSRSTDLGSLLRMVEDEPPQGATIGGGTSGEPL